MADRRDTSGSGTGCINELGEARRAWLLRLARATLDSYLTSGTIPDERSADPELDLVRGVFVTLTKHGQLRGCMGNMVGSQPLSQQVQHCAVTAAVDDPRFLPVVLEELGQVRIEISVLGPLVPVVEIDEIEVGVHGLLIERGGLRGTLLPQVAVENGWGRLEFLDHLCAKAGLPPGAWRTCRLHRYTADVFSE